MTAAPEAPALPLEALAALADAVRAFALSFSISAFSLTCDFHSLPRAEAPLMW
eukprot:CAMPEP_0197917360 /NCGR_PEP_ID=MMETSP1439-20131203/83701_1 /TAXON_ID=66791 /ORGANISM="Gonyaulax spinifera, Strain CCMP409" /LENGTH=52 /DNA_ID=CAMNT_0043539437 /DNA_START=60 /DNA_END=215 /DNA_ORIENTATION=+